MLLVHVKSSQQFGKVIAVSQNDFDNPYSPSVNLGSSPGMLDPNAEARVRPPAIAIMVAMGIGVVLSLIGTAGNLLGIGLAGANMGQDMLPAMLQGGVGLVQSFIGLAGGGFSMYAMSKMMKLENYQMSMIGSIVAMIPCVSPCCLLGLPFGIWSIVILNDAGIKAAFRS